MLFLLLSSALFLLSVRAFILLGGRLTLRCVPDGVRFLLVGVLVFGGFLWMMMCPLGRFSCSANGAFVVDCVSDCGIARSPPPFVVLPRRHGRHFPHGFLC